MVLIEKDIFYLLGNFRQGDVNDDAIIMVERMTLVAQINSVSPGMMTV